LPVILTSEEKLALKSEKDSVLPAKDMLIVILTVSLAAFLQGHVQSSINGSAPYLDCIFNTLIENGQCWNKISSNAQEGGYNATRLGTWPFGAVNASPFLFAAALGCPLAVPVNDLFGRRGAMVLAALLIFASSLGAAFVNHWHELFIVRIINGIGQYGYLNPPSGPTPAPSRLIFGL
jgi:MFS family permease